MRMNQMAESVNVGGRECVEMSGYEHCRGRGAFVKKLHPTTKASFLPQAGLELISHLLVSSRGRGRVGRSLLALVLHVSHRH